NGHHSGKMGVIDGYYLRFIADGRYDQLIGTPGYILQQERAIGTCDGTANRIVEKNADAGKWFPAGGIADQAGQGVDGLTGRHGGGRKEEGGQYYQLSHG